MQNSLYRGFFVNIKWIGFQYNWQIEVEKVNKNNISLRKANNEDIQNILPFIESFGLDNERLNPEEFVIAEIEGNLAGFGRIKSYHNVFELCTIGVIQQYRNIGVGKKIVNHLIQIFPFDEIWLTTKKPDYFSSFGFVESENPPYEVIKKCQRICLNPKSSPVKPVFMVLRKNQKDVKYKF